MNVFALTQEPYHDNSELVAVAASLADAQSAAERDAGRRLLWREGGVLQPSRHEHQWMTDDPEPIYMVTEIEMLA